MRQEVAELLSQDLGEIRDDYSGRGQYGKTTHAVVFDSRSDYERALIYAAYEVGARGEDGGSEKLRDLAKRLDDVVLGELQNIATDSLGLGIVVY